MMLSPLTLHQDSRPVFGGFLVSQALSAACATVPDTFLPYSSQSSFLAPSNGNEKIVYRVERTWEGRNRLNRVVNASQSATCVYTAIVSFQSATDSIGNTLEYGVPKPVLGQLPEDIDPNAIQALQPQSSISALSNGNEKFTYRVKKTLADGSWVTNVIHPSPNARVYTDISGIVTSSISNTIDFRVPRPALDRPPEDIGPDAIEALQSSMLNGSSPIMQQSAEDRPLEWKLHSVEMGERPTEFRVRGYFRSSPLSTESCTTHLAAFAYASDEFFFGPVFAANPMAVGKGARNVTICTSLTHNVSFHDSDAKIDEWAIVERETTWGSAGRVMVQQKMWDMDGKMILSSSQEALIRLKEAETEVKEVKTEVKKFGTEVKEAEAELKEAEAEVKEVAAEVKEVEAEVKEAEAKAKTYEDLSVALRNKAT
ncbi:HotDog domain-containing protein [Xylaria bambusicola]|uniref:HotDog domain-containing protein n=1 Tax=Xylaria bambusicola TaxID=326684 RepID=UPI0020074501|nr:HotDog domain-containing protein [Xylaria bambusicola]KAI0528158.1 HotDog domain-containing protein [Xylaria bambusicola]